MLKLPLRFVHFVTQHLRCRVQSAIEARIGPLISLDLNAPLRAWTFARELIRFIRSCISILVSCSWSTGASRLDVSRKVPLSLDVTYALTEHFGRVVPRAAGSRPEGW